MGDQTGISWTDATWNPVRGCSRVSEGCRNCYAEQQAARIVRMAKGKPSAYDGLVETVTRDVRQFKIVDGEPTGDFRTVTREEARWTGVVRLAPEQLAWPLRKKKPRRIFVNSMSDLFHEELTNEQIAAVFGVMAAAPQHTFQILTKRAKRMREWFAWVSAMRTGLITIPLAPRLICRVEAGRILEPQGYHITLGTDSQPRQWPLPNVWLGVSVENQDAADERIPELLRTPAALRFLSCEPLLGSVTLPVVHVFGPNPKWTGPKIDWVIAGCESGPGARSCDVAWLRSLRDHCASTGVAFFLKQAQATDLGKCGDADNPNGDRPCRQRITAYVISADTAAYSCGCTVEGSETGAGVPLGLGDDSKRKAGGVIELPYLDGVQHAAFPEVSL